MERTLVEPAAETAGDGDDHCGITCSRQQLAPTVADSCQLRNQLGSYYLMLVVIAFLHLLGNGVASIANGR